jgi:hypothetical protein
MTDRDEESTDPVADGGTEDAAPDGGVEDATTESEASLETGGRSRVTSTGQNWGSKSSSKTSDRRAAGARLGGLLCLAFSRTCWDREWPRRR